MYKDVLGQQTDLNTITTTCFIFVRTSEITNGPATTSTVLWIETQNVGVRCLQIATDVNDLSHSWKRLKNDQGQWQPWVSV